MKDILILLGFVLSLVLILGKFVEREKVLPRFFTILMLGNFAVYHMISYLLYCDHPFKVPDFASWAYILEAAGFMLFLFKGPMYYGYCLSVVTAGTAFPKRYILHYVPGLVYAAVYLPFAATRTSQGLASGHTGLFFPGHDKIHLATIFLCVIIYDVYLVLSIIRLYPMLKKFPERNLIFKVMIASYAAGICMTSFWPIDIMMKVEFTDNVRVGSLVYLMIVYLISCRYPERMVVQDADFSEKHYRKTQLQGIDTASLIARIDQIMRTEKAYRKKLSLATLARTLGIRQHQLSEILNKCLKTTFACYINDLRVEDAKTLLESRPDLQIIEISMETGFNSLSVFYREFKKRIGVSPAEYRRRNMAG